MANISMGTKSPLAGALALTLAAVLLLQQWPLGVTAGTSKAQGGQDEATTCMKNVNDYLNGLGLALTAEGQHEQEAASAQQAQMVQIRAALDLARKQLHPVKDNPQLAGELNLDTVYRPLVCSKCNTKAVLSLLEDLYGASEACDQVSLDLLMIVANFDLTKGQQEQPVAAAAASKSMLLNEFARRRIEACWQAYAGSVSRRLDRALGKMSAPVFGLMERLADKIRERKQPSKGSAGKRASRGSITIDDSKAVEANADYNTLKGGNDLLNSLDSEARLGQVMEALKGVSFDNEASKRDFALAVNSLFNSYKTPALATGNKKALIKEVLQFHEDFVVGPCRELVNRVKPIVELGEIFLGHMKQTLGQALASERQTNQRLDYELQVYRICKLGNQQSNNIALLLASMR